MKGYIYILINPSMDNIVKIGKTTRDPEDRVQELSAATGVPTKFFLVYKCEVQNCHSAEKTILDMLESQGKRVKSNREFFYESTTNAINLIIRVCDEINASYRAKENILCINSINSESDIIHMENQGVSLAISFCNEGKNYYFGQGGYIQGYSEAYDHFKKSAELGSAEAHYWLGVMHRHGQACSRKPNEAIALLNKAANLGYTSAYAEIGLIYTENKNTEYSNNFWDKYFCTKSRLSADYDKDPLVHLYLANAVRSSQKIRKSFYRIILDNKNYIEEKEKARLKMSGKKTNNIINRLKIIEANALT